MKYYIVSLGAIFIALGIGILVGFNINNNEELNKQQASMISDLDQKFGVLKDKNDALKEDLADSELKYKNLVSFIDKNSDMLIANTLADKKVGIISVDKNNDFSNAIVDSLKGSNAEVSYNIVINDGVKQPEKMKELSQKAGTPIKTTEDVINYVVESLSDSNGLSKLEHLQDLNIIKINYINSAFSSYDTAVISAGGDSKEPKKNFDALDAYLVGALQDKEKHVVEVQNSAIKTSYVDYYSKLGVATIDNIDQKSGIVSLAILINDEKQVGNFGVLDTAASLLPTVK
jgi:hypothetical protein